MSASTQEAKGKKTYEKFLKKLGVRPKSVAILAKQVGCSPGTIRRMASEAVRGGPAVSIKKGNSYQYAKVPHPEEVKMRQRVKEAKAAAKSAPAATVYDRAQVAQ